MNNVTLQQKLMEDENFLTAVQDDNAAHAVYFAFCNQVYRDTDQKTKFSMSWRSAGSFVATARDKGESYLDFYCSDVSALTPRDGRSPEQEAAFWDDWFLRLIDSLGWYRIGEAETQRDRARAVDILVTSESRIPSPSTSAWLREFPYLGERAKEACEGLVKNPNPSPYDRALAAIGDGRMTESEWALFCELSY